MCMCSFFFYFADVFSSAMRSAYLRGLLFLRDLVFYSPLQVLIQMLRWLNLYFLQVFLYLQGPALDHGLTAFPASSFHFAIYLRHLMTEAKTTSPLETAVYGIAWFHLLGGEPSPTEHPLKKSSTRMEFGLL